MSWKAGNQRAVLQLPGDATSSALAAVAVSPGSGIQVVVDIIPNPAPNWLGSYREEQLYVISPEPATLWDCLIAGSPMSAFASQISFTSALAALGVHMPPGDREFDEISVEAIDVGSWFGQHGFHVDGVESGRPLKFTYTPISHEWWDIDGQISVAYGVNMNLRRDRHPREALHMEEQPVIAVRGKNRLTFETLMRVVGKTLSFVEFCTDNGVQIGRVFGERSDFPDASIELVAAWKQPTDVSNSIHWLVFHEVIKDNFGEHLAKWFALYDQLPLALDLYRTCKRTSGLQVEFRLFSIISALESLHRSLFGEGPVHKCDKCKRKAGMSLEQRLQEIVAKHGGWIKNLLTTTECARVADTRNYLAHQTPALAARSIDSDEWFFWYRRLAMVFEICILAELPFQHPDALKNTINNRWAGITSGSLGEWNLQP